MGVNDVCDSLRFIGFIGWVFGKEINPEVGIQDPLSPMSFFAVKFMVGR